MDPIEAVTCYSVSEGDAAVLICLMSFVCKPEAVGIITVN